MQFSTLKENFERQLRKFILLCKETPLNELTTEERDSDKFFYQFEENDKWYIVLHEELYTQLQHRIDPLIYEDWFMFGNKIYEYNNHICSWVFFEER